MKISHRRILLVSIFSIHFSFASTTANSNAEKEIRSSQNLSNPDFWNKLSQKHGNAAFHAAQKIANADTTPDAMRWRCLFGAARVAGKNALPWLDQMAHHKHWLIRDASLKAMAALGATESKESLERALKDKALVVRTTAVDAIGHLTLRASGPVLVEALFDPINYRGEKALWIHKHILFTIEKLQYREASPRLVELLETRKDPELRSHLIVALEKLNGRNFRGRPVNEQIYLWRRNIQADQIL